ncbi:MAG TPA: glycosyltransferase family A protein [Herbaspirillum sp.]|jgi:glycosyltransferase involved in cell wall biosynthesis
MSKKISIFLITYNHELFIGECIDSILNQSNLDEIEIIWHDDNSSDRTQAIGDEALRGKNIQVKRIFKANNRYQKRIPFLLDMLEQVEGEYIALLEGDDFWIDINKLQLQKDALDTFKDIDICFGRSQVVNLQGTRVNQLLGSYGDTPLNIPASDVIRGDGGFMHTGSILLRTDIFKNAPAWIFEKQPVGDYIYQVLGSLRNGALYLPFDFSSWRSQNPNSFTGKYESNINANLDFEAEFIRLLKKMQASFDQKYKADFDQIIYNHFVTLLGKAIPNNQFGPISKAALYLNS